MHEIVEFRHDRHHQDGLQRMVGVVRARRLSIEKTRHRAEQHRIGAAIFTRFRPEPGRTEAWQNDGRRAGD
jgi:hypothetical protein